MSNFSPDRRRHSLSRVYQLTADLRMDLRGHRSSDDAASPWRQFLRGIELQFLPHYFGLPPRWRLKVRALSGERTLPDFCVIGAPKCGTTDLAVSLLLHPNVLAPLCKEFWSANPDSWRILYPTHREKRRHAERHGMALSPFLVPCLHRIELLHSLARARPGAKIVLTLRKPEERVYSQWKWEVFLAGRKRAANLPFLSSFSAYVDKALEVYPDYPMFTACGFCPLMSSVYWKAVGYWRESFGPENVMALDMADYFCDRNRALRRIQEFVGLPYVPIPQFSTRINENPLALPPPDEPSLAKLRAFFRPSNERLWDVIGERWNWH